MKTCDDMLFRQSSILKELLHQFILAGSDGFHQDVVCSFCCFLHRCRNRSFFSLSISTRRVEISFHGDQVYDSAEVFFLSNGKVNGNTDFSECFMDGFQCSVKAGSFPIQLVDHNGMPLMKFFSKGPDLFCLDLNS